MEATLAEKSKKNNLLLEIPRCFTYCSWTAPQREGGRKAHLEGCKRSWKRCRLPPGGKLLERIMSYLTDKTMDHGKEFLTGNVGGKTRSARELVKILGRSKQRR